jgi:hypothetical protein
MIIYNVTVKISNEKHDDWVRWMKTVHIPEVMETGSFEDFVFSRILVEDEDGINYSIQYRCADLTTLENYQEKFAPELQQKHTERYKDHFVAFRTLLQTVD